MASVSKDISGQTFGRLVALRRVANVGSTAAWLCSCACGSEHVARAHRLRNGTTQSCGCGVVLASRTHGQSTTRIFNRWNSMIQRCTNPASKSYIWYGARGIRVCERWMTFESFIEDMGHPPAGTSIDRINNDGNYEPSNCRWATAKEQSANRRCSRPEPIGVMYGPRQAPTHCKHGHELSGKNLRIRNGRSECRECFKGWQAGYRKRNAALQISSLAEPLETAAIRAKARRKVRALIAKGQV